MDNYFSPENIQKASNANLDVLADYDACGFLLGANETAENFAKRLQNFYQHLQKHENALEKNGKDEIEDGITVTLENKISKNYFHKVSNKTWNLYRFKIDWIPGFFKRYSFFEPSGGFTLLPEKPQEDFFVIFVLRQSFKTNQRWYIWNRDILLAHELCHVARLALMSDEFEETFAYQTSTSVLQKTMGKTLGRQFEAAMFLGVVLILLLGQILRTYCFPSIPIWPFWSLVGLVFAWLLIRHAFHCRRLAKAQRHIAELFGKENALPVLFRCTDEELHRFASTQPQPLKSWIEEQTSMRWQIIRKRFPLK